MPLKNMAKVNLIFFMVVFLMNGHMKRSVLYVGKIRWKLLVWVRVERVYLLRPSEKYRLLFGFSDDLQSSLYSGILD